MTVQAVVFDIGNVLMEWHPERFYRAEIGAARQARLWAEVDLHGMNLRVDLGADLSDEVEALAARHPDWAPEIRMWRDRWLDMAAPDIPASAHLLRRLRARGVPVFALSNFGRATFEIACRAYPVLTEFDQTFVSAHLGVMKPDPRIYAHLETETGLAPGALLFTDDRPENVDAAAARGWRTHLFETPQGWAERLVAEGLLAPAEAAP